MILSRPFLLCLHQQIVKRMTKRDIIISVAFVALIFVVLFLVKGIHSHIDYLQDNLPLLEQWSQDQ